MSSRIWYRPFFLIKYFSLHFYIFTNIVINSFGFTNSS